MLTVTELTAKVRRTLEGQIGTVWVTGEVSNLRLQSSGHIYFTLKDAGAQLNCVLFRGEAIEQRKLLQDGQKVVVQGDLTVYEPRGQYQLVARQVELQGLGALQLAFDRLKRKLEAEGLFATERKRPLPRFPQRIGLVTSPTGAAIRDILHVIQRRNPSLELVLAPCRVQGLGAAEEIAAAIRLLNEWPAGGGAEARVEAGAALGPETPRHLDLILITRGGGSLEDLWAFNEEVVARAIFSSALPVMSAVGHEIDFTISDFVADFRAATPSAAAEILTESAFASHQTVIEARRRLRQLVRQRWERSQDACQQLAHRLARVHPRRRLNELLQRLDDLEVTLGRRVVYRLREVKTEWQSLWQRLLRTRPTQVLLRRRQVVSDLELRLLERTQARLGELRNRHAKAEDCLRLLSPVQVLMRGYSITMDAATGRILRTAGEVGAGQKLKTRLADGEFRSTADG
ncbi:MAG: exodeoxyribonuclease VII large subunit [Candidatus Omnitrophica bacterium]|nr:exodeoxyribonuclease VII large subunit [Candidatus Omnitrophota bacterium]